MTFEANDSLLELHRPECWLGDRDYEIHIAGPKAVTCVHGWLPTDPDSTCECWETTNAA